MMLFCVATERPVAAQDSPSPRSFSTSPKWQAADEITFGGAIGEAVSQSPAGAPSGRNLLMTGTSVRLRTSTSAPNLHSDVRQSLSSGQAIQVVAHRPLLQRARTTPRPPARRRQPDNRRPKRRRTWTLHPHPPAGTIQLRPKPAAGRHRGVQCTTPQQSLLTSRQFAASALTVSGCDRKSAPSHALPRPHHLGHLERTTRLSRHGRNCVHHRHRQQRLQEGGVTWTVTCATSAMRFLQFRHDRQRNSHRLHRALGRPTPGRHRHRRPQHRYDQSRLRHHHHHGCATSITVALNPTRTNVARRGHNRQPHRSRQQRLRQRRRHLDSHLRHLRRMRFLQFCLNRQRNSHRLHRARCRSGPRDSHRHRNLSHRHHQVRLRHHHGHASGSDYPGASIPLHQRRSSPPRLPALPRSSATTPRTAASPGQSLAAPPEHAVPSAPPQPPAAPPLSTPRPQQFQIQTQSPSPQHPSPTPLSLYLRPSRSLPSSPTAPTSTTSPDMTAPVRHS